MLLAEESEFIEDDHSMSITRSSKRPRLQNGVNDEEEDLSSVTGLKLKVSKLVQELSAEQAKVEELQELNQTLQKGKCLDRSEEVFAKQYQLTQPNF